MSEEQQSNTMAIVEETDNDGVTKIKINDEYVKCFNENSDVDNKKFQSENNSTKQTVTAGVVNNKATVSSENFNVKSAEERLAERRKSLVPMSSMEEENLRERLHLAQLRQCSAIVYNEVRYTKDTFRRMFQTKVNVALNKIEPPRRFIY